MSLICRFYVQRNLSPTDSSFDYSSFLAKNFCDHRLAQYGGNYRFSSHGEAMKTWSSVAAVGGAVLQVPNYLIYLQRVWRFPP